MGITLYGFRVAVSIHARHHWRAMRAVNRVTDKTTEVSIHARHHWRAMPCRFMGYQQRRGVSIHARHHWRAMRGAGIREHIQRDVSIHARHHWRAMPKALRVPLADVQFQSTPAITGGRCICAYGWGRSWLGFNPRPPSLAGDAFGGYLHGCAHKVSIHARHHWRAMPQSSGVCIGLAMFQSTPAITGGRCQRQLRVGRLLACFNPRPPSLAGDARGWCLTMPG